MVKIIAWDFDGVLNRNIIDGNFIWKQTFEEDLGVSETEFSEYVFGSGRFAPVLTGDRDLRDLVADWLVKSACTKSPDEILSYWFAKDANPDSRTLALLERANAAGLKNVIATNNEARRAAYIENEMGYGAKIDRIFAAGPMGCKKPDATFFETIEAELGARPTDLMLIDDREENVVAARAIGWHGFYFRYGDYAGLEEILFG